MVNSDLFKFYSYFVFAVKNNVLMMMLYVKGKEHFSLKFMYLCKGMLVGKRLK